MITSAYLLPFDDIGISVTSKATLSNGLEQTSVRNPACLSGVG